MVAAEEEWIRAREGKQLKASGWPIDSPIRWHEQEEENEEAMWREGGDYWIGR